MENGATQLSPNELFSGIFDVILHSMGAEKREKLLDEVEYYVKSLIMQGKNESRK